MATALFNPASVSALLSVVVSAIAAACAFLLGRVPDWDDVRPLTWVALTAAAAAGCNFTATLEVPSDVYLWTGRLQVLSVALHVCAWHVYLTGWGNRSLTSAHRAALWALVAAGLVALWPGAVYGDAVALRPLAWLGVVYHDPVVTPVGAVVYGIVAAFGVWGVGMAARLGRAGAAFPVAHLGCMATILAMAAHDALVVGGVPLPTPYLLDFAFYGPITVLGLITIGRVGQSATDLRHLSAGLAGLVAQGSSDLQRSQQALARAERLAALGQFAAGVAQEISTPASVAAASLDRLSGQLADDPRDTLWSNLRDAQAGVGRIVALSRQLLVAGRTASRPDVPVAPVHAASAVEAALGMARARGPLARVEVQVPLSLFVLANEASLVQVLDTLLVNAVHALPPGREGRVAVRAEEEAGLVRLVVEDDGVGMSEEALLHVFEPFCGTKPPGMGTGLGLAVSLGLATSMQGRLHFESTLGQGTRAFLELRRAAAPPARPDPAATPVARSRILVVDDDEHVRSALARLLGRTHQVSVAGGVQAGLQALAAAEFDLILCDVMMPNGGGERLWGELPLRAPWAMERLAFMTGGAPTPEARAFLASQPRPLLEKPFELAVVQELLADLQGPGRGPGAAATGQGPADAPSEPGSPRSVGRLRRP